jgi:riboflavin synthase
MIWPAQPIGTIKKEASVEIVRCAVPAIKDLQVATKKPIEEEDRNEGNSRVDVGAPEIDKICARK